MSGTGATQAFYGRWARLYDRLATAPGVQSWRRRSVDALDLDPGDTVVEMGCGTGANLPLLREAVGPDGTVLAVDVTRGMLGHARERVANAGWENVHLVQGDATTPPVRPAAAVDGLLATFVVGMFADPGAVVADWCDLVGTGGRVALLNFQRSEHPAATPLNAAFAGFVWLSSPRKRIPRTSPTRQFEARVRAGREALTRRSVERGYETFAGGYLGLVSGTVE